MELFEMTWICQNFSSVLNTLGIIVSWAGALFTAYETIKPYTGCKHTLDEMAIAIIMGVVYSPKDVETNEFKAWLRKKHIYQIIGLLVLVIGVCFQIISNWV